MPTRHETHRGFAQLLQTSPALKGPATAHVRTVVLVGACVLAKALTIELGPGCKTAGRAWQHSDRLVSSVHVGFLLCSRQTAQA